MEKITERERAILNLIIKEYTKIAKPISSDFLKKKYKLNVCPATIRNDMHCLSEKKYLSKLYSSAGRTPTTKAYKLFVKEILEDLEPEQDSFFNIIEDIEKTSKNDFQFISSITKNIADSSCSFAFIYCENYLYKEGWKEIIQNPEFSQKETLKNFLKVLDLIEKNIEELTDNPYEVKVYIGKEKNIDLKDFGLIIGNTIFPKNQKGILAIMGPERMNYNKNIEIINSLIKTLNKPNYEQRKNK